MNYSTVMLEPSVVEQAKSGAFPEAVCPKWLKEGVFDFQFDSIQYQLRAGEPTNLPEDVARHAERRATFVLNHLIGPAIRPVVVKATMPAGVQSAFACPACGSEFGDYKLLASHIIAEHTEPITEGETTNESAGEPSEVTGDVRPAAPSPLGSRPRPFRSRA